MPLTKLECASKEGSNKRVDILLKGSKDRFECEFRTISSQLRLASFSFISRSCVSNDSVATSGWKAADEIEDGWQHRERERKRKKLRGGRRAGTTTTRRNYHNFIISSFQGSFPSRLEPFKRSPDTPPPTGAASVHPLSFCARSFRGSSKRGTLVHLAINFQPKTEDFQFRQFSSLFLSFSFFQF